MGQENPFLHPRTKEMQHLHMAGTISQKKKKKKKKQQRLFMMAVKTIPVYFPGCYFEHCYNKSNFYIPKQRL